MAGPPNEHQRAVVHLNDRAVGQLQLTPKLSRYSLQIPTAGWRRGFNRLRFEFEKLSSPVAGRRLAAVVDKVLIKPGDEYGQRRFRPEQPTAKHLKISVLDKEPGAPRALHQPGDTCLVFDLLPRAAAELHFLRQRPTWRGKEVADATIEICQDEKGEPSCRLVTRHAALRPEPASWQAESYPLPELEKSAGQLRFCVENNLNSLGRGWPGQVWGNPRILSGKPEHSELLFRPLHSRDPSFESTKIATPEPLSTSPPGVLPGLPPSGQIRHVIVYLIDTLRADALLDPNMDLPYLRRLLERGTWYGQAWSTSSWTRPAVGTLLTGRIPSEHGARNRQHQLRHKLLRLPGWLRQQGFTTGGFVANGNIAAGYGFDHGFDHYQHVFAPATEVHQAALSWMEKQEDRPSFTYLHVIDPHDPYTPLGPHARLAESSEGFVDATTETLQSLKRGRRMATEEQLQGIRALYRAETRQLDSAVGDFLEALQRMERAKNTAIILVSDHGEAFSEHHTWLHGGNLHPEQSRILLAVSTPEAVERRLEASAVSLAQVPASVCSLLGVPVPSAFQSSGPLLLELSVDGVQRWGALGADWFYSFSPGINYQPQLHARLEDPGHQNNLASQRPFLALALEGWISKQMSQRSTHQADEPLVDEAELDPAAVEQLRALGYLQRGPANLASDK